MRRARVDQQLGVQDQEIGVQRRRLYRHDLIVATVNDERGYIEVFQVFSEVGFRKCFDAINVFLCAIPNYRYSAATRGKTLRADRCPSPCNKGRYLREFSDKAWRSSH